MELCLLGGWSVYVKWLSNTNLLDAPASTTKGEQVINIVERLRKLRGPDVWEAADRIELLEQALVDIFDHECRLNSDRSYIAIVASDALWPEGLGEKE